MKLANKLILSTLLISNSILANVNEIPKIMIFHINGVNTTNIQAQNNLDNLRNKSKIDSNIVTWNFIYNPTSGNLAKDLIDVFNQKRQEGLNLDLDDYVEVYLKTYNFNYKKGSKEYNEVKDKIKVIYKEDPSFVGKNLDVIVKDFHKQIESLPKKPFILFIPHSQGNLYANQLYEYITNGDKFPKDHVKILGIASPADEVKGKGKYITAKNDYVIGSLGIFSAFVPKSNSPMSGNVKLNECEDILCHNLVGSYLKDKDSLAEYIYDLHLDIASLYTTLKDKQAGKSINFIYPKYMLEEEVFKILNDSGNEVCNTKECDRNNFAYLKTNSLEYDRLGSINPGAYYAVSSVLFSYLTMPISITGNLSSAIDFTYGNDCNLVNSKEYVFNQMFQSVSVNSMYMCVPGNMIINGNQIISRFVIY